MTDPSFKSSIAPKIWFRSVCGKNGLHLSDSQLTLLERYAALLLDWNKKVNLISRKDEENVWQGHLLHSVSIVLLVEIAHGLRVLDLGTGGGLPGIPLKICRPDLSLTLLDATKKKVDAVGEMVRSLELQSIDTCWGRAEELGRQAKYSHRYDLVVSRAVASLKDLAKWAKPFLRTPPATTKLIALKGGDLATEIRHAKSISGVKDISTVELNLAEATEFLASDKKILVVAF